MKTHVLSFETDMRFPRAGTTLQSSTVVSTMCAFRCMNELLTKIRRTGIMVGNDVFSV